MSLRGTCRRFGVAFAVSLVGVIAGCGSSRGDHPGPGSSFEQLRNQPPEETAATVGGHPLGKREFQTAWRADRDWSVETLIERVVDREVAVQRAIERGYHRADELGYVRKKGMVRALLRREIEGDVGAEDLDDELVGKIEKKLRQKLGHPRGIRASHLLVMVPQKKKQRKKLDIEALEAKAKTWAERIEKSLPTSPSVEDLFFARREFRDELPDPLAIVVNAHMSFPVPDSRPFNGDLPTGWMNVVSAFATAADDLLDEGRAGELSAPVESKYGWHLVRAEKRLDGKVPDPEALHEVAVSRALRVERAKLFQSRLEQWRQGMSIAGYPEAIAEQADRESK